MRGLADRVVVRAARLAFERSAFDHRRPLLQQFTSDAGDVGWRHAQQRGLRTLGQVAQMACDRQPPERAW